MIRERCPSKRCFAAAAELWWAVWIAAVAPAFPQGAVKKDNAQSAGVSEIRPAPGSEIEQLPDGSSGRVVEFRSSDGTFLAAYLRRPSGSGRFPVVVILHGGGPDKEGTYALGRITIPPTGEFVAAGWAVLTYDYRPDSGLKKIEWDDAIAAIAAVRRLPFIDGQRVALLGGSHGANIISRLASRVDVRCGVLCAPAAIDFIEIQKAIDSGADVVPALKKLIGGAETTYGAKMAEIEKNPARYGYQSSFTEVAKVRFPLLIVNGHNDNNSPIPVAEAYVAKLRAAGKHVETYFPNNGPHGFYNVPHGHYSDQEPLGFYFRGTSVAEETKEAERRTVSFIRTYFNSKP